MYNLLTMRCEWAVEVAGVGSISADSASSHWAATLSSPGSSSSNSTARGTGGSSASVQGIVMFNGAEESPVAAWRVHRSGPPGSISIAFVPCKTPLHAAAVEAGVNVPGSSPLVVLTADREYSIARRSGSSDGSASGSGIASRIGTYGTGIGKEISAFEAMYGRSARVEKQQGGANGLNSGSISAVDVGVAGVGGRPPWASLFDAPSHALPPMGTLCPAFLELMVTGGQDGNEQ